MQKEKVYKEGTFTYIYRQNQPGKKNSYPILLTFSDTIPTKSLGLSEQKRSRQDEGASDSQAVSHTVTL